MRAAVFLGIIGLSGFGIGIAAAQDYQQPVPRLMLDLQPRLPYQGLTGPRESLTSGDSASTSVPITRKWRVGSDVSSTYYPPAGTELQSKSVYVSHADDRITFTLGKWWSSEVDDERSSSGSNLPRKRSKAWGANLRLKF